MFFNDLAEAVRENEEVLEVFYHGSCIDGFAAATLFYLDFKDAVYTAVNYGSIPEPKETTRVAVFVDFTPTIEWLELHGRKFEEAFFLDHHFDKAPVYEYIKYQYPNFYTMFDTTRSGAMLAWNFLCPNLATPRAILQIGNRDLGKITTEEERLYHEVFCLFLGEEKSDFELFGDIITGGNMNFEEKVVKKALTIAPFIAKNIDFFIKKAKVKRANIAIDNKVESILIAYVTAPYYLASEFAWRYLDKFPDVSLVVNLTYNDAVMGFSFRSRMGTKYANAAAKLFNGGGHPAAAGGRFNGLLSATEVNNRININFNATEDE